MKNFLLYYKSLMEQLSSFFVFLRTMSVGFYNIKKLFFVLLLPLFLMLLLFGCQMLALKLGLSGFDFFSIFKNSVFYYSCLVLILILYIYCLKILNNSLIITCRDSVAILAGIFFCVTIILISTIAILMQIAQINIDGVSNTTIDLAYYVSTTFTTLGYGEMTPKDDIGKITSMFISILGITHMVSFLTIVLFSKGRKEELGVN